MNSKRKDLQYASVFLLAVALTFLMGKGDNLWLVELMVNCAFREAT